jgi:glycosyltransferase involved in cell wall biosynthesis
MRIVHVSTYDINGGAARAAYRLHAGLGRIGEDSWMVVGHKTSTDERVLGVAPANAAEEYAGEVLLSTVIQGFYLDSNRTDVSDTLFSLPYPGCDLTALPPVQTADIINLHWVARYQSPLTLRRLFAAGKPVVWTLHDQGAFTGGCCYSAGCERYRQDCVACPQLADDPLNLPAATLKDKAEMFAGANLTIVAPSRWLAACAMRSRLFKGLRVEVIPSSLDTDVFSPLPKAEAKHSLGLDAQIVTLLFVAELGNKRRKGFHELADAIQHCLVEPAFRSLADSDGIRAICLGRPNDEIASLGIPATSLGYLTSEDEISRAYSAADIFVLPSLEDNLPNTLLEAMSCGTPVVAFAVGGVPDVVADGVTGLLAPPGDTRQLSRAMLSLALDPGRREMMGHKCRTVMIEEYALPIQARRYVELYRELYQKQVEPTPATPIEGDMPVQLETAVGPHFQQIYDAVLFKALKEYAPTRERDYEDVKHRHTEQLQQQREALQRLRQQLQQRDEDFKQKNEQLKQKDHSLEQLAAQNRELTLQLNRLRDSWSWKITAPFRKAADVVTKRNRAG